MNKNRAALRRGPRTEPGRPRNPRSSSEPPITSPAAFRWGVPKSTVVHRDCSTRRMSEQGGMGW
eukprot:4844413-Pyramimonas_sp.AAC.1